MNSVGEVLALIFVAGLVGGFLIARSVSGLRAVFGWLLWLLLPFAVLAFILWQQIDPTLPPERVSYNFAFGFVLVSIIVAVPWLVANLIGGLIGWRFRKPAPAPASLAESWSEAEAELPDWSEADNPLLSLRELGEMMHAAAELADIDPRGLPHVGPIPGGEGEFVDRDKFDYIYMGLERGQPMFDHRTAVADELLYFVFRDRAFALAANRLAEHRRAGSRFPDHEYAGRLAAEQQAILGDIEPAWGRQFASERARRAGG